MRLFAFAAALSMAGCAADDAEDTDIPTNPAEVETEEGAFVIHLTPGSDPFKAGEEIELGLHVMVDDMGVSGATLSLTPFMPDMGHGMDETPAVTEGDMMGMFTATWTFPMAGLWEVEIEVETADDTDAATVAYEVE